MGLLGRIRRRFGAALRFARGAVEHNRIRFGWFDHLIRAVQRYQVQSGDRLAGAVTYFAFLSFFPLIALAFAAFGFVVAGDPRVLAALTQAINEQLPGLADQLRLEEIAAARTSVGIIGLLGLLYAGLGAVEALRDALREIWMTGEQPLNYFLARLRDLVALVLIGVTMIASTLTGTFATQATGTVAGWLGLAGSGLEVAVVRAAGLAVSVAADTLVFVIILGWLGRAPRPLRVILRGALAGAIGFGLLKQLATLVLASTMGNPVYGTVAVVVGLLVWINFSARLLLYVAAWTATSEMGPPPQPTPVPSVAGGGFPSAAAGRDA